MDELSVVGQVVGGSFGDIVIRQKAGTDLEIGDLMISEENGSFLILQVFELQYGSQIQDKMQQMMSGVNLEQGVADAHFYEPDFVNYVLARIKPLARVYRENNDVKIPKSLPSFFNKLRLITKNDLEFLQKEKDSVFVGYIRSGSKWSEIEVNAQKYAEFCKVDVTPTLSILNALYYDELKEYATVEIKNFKY